MKNSIAVIIPVYNTEKYLAESLDSVLQQTWTNLTVFAVNDGSTDRSAEILDSYSKKDNRLKVIHKPNGGASSARNVALDAIQNSGDQFDFIHFFDSDDLLERTAYEYAIESLNAYEANYVIFPILEFDKKGFTTEKEQTSFLVLEGQDEIANFFFQTKAYFKKYYSFRALGNKIFKADLFSNLRFNTALKTTEDQDVFLRLLPNLKKGVTVPNQFFYYRLRKSSLVRSTAMNGNLHVFSELHFNPLCDYTEATNTLIFNDYVKALVNSYLFAVSNNSPTADVLAKEAKTVLTQTRYPISKAMKRKLYQCLLPRFLASLYVKYRINKKMRNKQNPNYFD